MTNQTRLPGLIIGAIGMLAATAYLSSTTTSSAAAATTQVVAAAAAGGDAAKGQKLFAANCAACHGAHAEGGMGPTLKGEKGKKNFAAAVAWIKNPTPPMPKLYPSPLSEKDVNDVAAFVETL